MTGDEWGGSLEARIAGWRGEAVVVRRDPGAGAWIFIALHDSRLGTPVGGTRLKPYPNPGAGLRDALRLAEGMTYKWAAVDFPFGGGKAVLCLDRPLDPGEREGLLDRYGRLLRTLNGAFKTGVDLGTTPGDMRRIARKTEHVMGVWDGESRDPGPYTALGVLVGIRTSLEHALGRSEAEGTRVLVQGVGDVGEPLARLLAEEGADLVLSDIDAARAGELAEELGAGTLPPERVPGADCDVYAPCAVGGVLDPETIPRLRCRIVCGSANNQLESPDDALRLHERGILYAPDYVVNAGGAIAFGMMHRGTRDDGEIRTAVRRIGDSLAEILAEAERDGEPPAAAARRRAERILDRAGDGAA